MRSLDGRDVSVIVYTTPIRDETGEIMSVMEMSTDITEIKVLQEQVRKSQELYRLLFEEAPCYITIQNKDYEITEANRRFCEDFGDYRGRKCFDIYKHREEVCVPCWVQATFQDGKMHASESLVTCRSGEQMNVLVHSAPIREPGGKINSVMEMSINITPIRRLQSQLESIGLLISSISHGIKGMLTGLDGGVYMVRTGLEKDNRRRLQQGWEMVQRNVDRIRNMVLNILYYAKERELHLELVSASDLARDVSGLMEAKAREQGITLQADVDGDIGDFEVDAKALRSLLVNLMENSVDACRVDKRKTDHLVTLGLSGDSDHIQFEVTDNGIGMDQETREKAFSLFFSSKGAEGTGLGLFIANNIARKHGGSVEVESELGKGTRFVVKIPRRRTESRATELPVEQEANHG